jgi:hypothetical protein
LVCCKNRGIFQLDFFSQLENKSISEIGGSGLLHKYNKSLPVLLSSVYTEYEWLPWRFTVTPHHFWEDKNNQKQFMDWAGNKLQIKNRENWYKVSTQVFPIFCAFLIFLRV